MKYCKQCGAPTPDSQYFCSNCGHRLEEANNMEQKAFHAVNHAEQQDFEVEFKRPSSYAGHFNAFKITVDDHIKYELKNGRSVYISLPSGHHNISISVFGFVCKKEFQIDITDNKRLTCTLSMMSSALLGTVEPVKVVDEKGRVY